MAHATLSRKTAGHLYSVQHDTSMHNASGTVLRFFEDWFCSSSMPDWKCTRSWVSKIHYLHSYSVLHYFIQ